MPSEFWLTSIKCLFEFDMAVVVGETIQVSKVTALIEEITKKKLEVRTIAQVELERRVASIPGIGSSRKEMMEKMLAQIELLMLEDDAPRKSMLEPVLNRFCPEVKLTSVRQYLEDLVKGHDV